MCKTLTTGLDVAVLIIMISVILSEPDQWSRFAFGAIAWLLHGP